jgi:CSLREA domain-containing protein
MTDTNCNANFEPRPPGGQRPATWCAMGPRSRLEAPARHARRASARRAWWVALLAFAAAGAQAQVFTVNSAADPGDGVCNAANCTLREAILAANDPATFSPTIDFAIPGTGPHTIMLLVPLPTLTRDMIIRGFTQPGAVAPPFGNPLAFTVRVQLDGSLIPDSGSVFALHINAPSFGDPDISGLSFVNFSRAQGDGAAIWVQLGRNVTISGNHIGTSADGSTALANDIGVRVDSGGATRVQSNLISGNRVGVLASGRRDANSIGLRIDGNRIGTNKAGAAAMPNTEDGIRVVSGCAAPAQSFAIGGNLISGNGRDGIHLAGETAGCVQLTGSVAIEANRIGTNAAGNAPLSNGRHGIATQLASSPTSLRIGSGLSTSFPESRNTLGFNLGAGIAVLDAGSGATMRENTYRANFGLPIDLGGDGADANDAGDADSGPNRRLNSPTLLSRRDDGGSAQVRYLVDAASPNVRFPLRVDFYTVLDGVQTFRSTDSYDVAGAVRTATVAGVGENDEVVAMASDDINGEFESRPSQSSEFSGVAPRVLFADGFE